MSMGFEDARHLLVRTGFGCTYAELERHASMTRRAAVDALIEGVGATPTVAPPAWVNAAPPTPEMRRSRRKLLRRRDRQRGRQLKAWWWEEMAKTPSPFTERLTLFWHNHFTSGLRKVKAPTLMYRQSMMLRSHLRGSFRDMLSDVARDPAMILYLDNQTNRKKKPNENFARELMELFTLGIGHYTEADIKAAARAFTGWKVRKKTGQFHFAARRHDDGVKVFLGQKGRWGGEDILEMILDRPEAGVFIVEKFWRAFLAAPPNKKTVARWAEAFRESDYALEPLLRRLLMSDAFWAEAERGARLKSPVELMVGTLRSLRVEVDDYEVIAKAGRRLGQDLLEPPNVKGWPGGEEWISSQTLLTRQQLMRRALTLSPLPKRLAMGGLSGALGLGSLSPAEQQTAARRLLLAPSPIEPEPPKGGGDHDALEALILSPIYQLI